jgi:putative SOS response-associated peptidase YedK
MTESRSERELIPLLWGLIPHWAKEKGTYSTINARIETVDTKPAYRSAFRHKRCIVPADGYFEWEQLEGGKEPWYFQRPDNKPLALAGLWDIWTGPDGKEIESFTILVRPAIPGISAIHDRMPAVLPEDLWDEWLNPESRDVVGMKDQLMLGDPGLLEWYRVSRRVNSAKNEGSELLNRT